MTNLWNDLHYALRQLRKTPGFTSAAVLTLALGIGASAAMFSVLDAVLLHSLPYNDVNRIVSVETFSRAYDAGKSPTPSSWPAYLDMRRLTKSFSAFAGVQTQGDMTLNQGTGPIYVQGTQGTDNFFDALGVRPLLGRTFLPGEDKAGKNDVVVLSYEIWRQDFGSKPSVIGKTVRLDGTPYTVIGVMPAGFRYPIGKPNLVYTPLHVPDYLLAARGTHWLRTFGRLKPSVAIARASADVNHAMDELGKQYPDHDAGRFARLTSLANAIHVDASGRNDKSELWVLLAAVLAVLLIACTNVAGLLLARGLLREREMAVRSALGAGRQRLVGQMLTESILLGLGGGICGLAIAGLLLTGLKQFLEKAFARGGNVHLNVAVLVATFVIALIASVGAGMAPAWRAAHVDPSHALKAGGSTGTMRHQHRLRASFVVVQVALSLMLLVCSGLLLLGLRSMLESDLGFNPKNLLTLGVDVPRGAYKGRDIAQALIAPLEERVRAIPGVVAAGSNNMLPIRDWGSNSDLDIVGQPPDPPDRDRFSEIRFITPGYLAAMQIPIAQGRDFTAQDAANTQPVAIVNEAWVKEFQPPRGPLGHAFSASKDGKHNPVIVGLSGSGRQDINEPFLAEIDFPMTQMPALYQAIVTGFTLFVRTDVSPTSIVPQLRKALHDVAPEVAFRTPETMKNVLSDSLVTNRMLSWLFGLFAAVAVLLTAIGIYGLLSQEVASRTRDIGVRMALGATRSGVAQLVLGRVGTLLAIGLGAGLLGVYLVRQVLTSILTIQFHRDAWAIAATAIGLGIVGLISAMLPARRAASIDPMRALRME
ncbi:MAG: ABC transporter permease [Acidobacteriaceae bacterium]